jgi:DNA polymerase-3 subunit beta
MKTTISREKTHSALVNAGKFTTGIRTQNENLGVFITFQNNKIVVLGIQESKFFQEEMDCVLDCKETTSFSVETKKLVEFLQNLSASDIQLSLEKNGLKVSTGKTNALFPISVKQELIHIPTDCVNKISLDPKIILDLLPQLLFCVATDSARPTLSSIKCIPQDNNRALFVTTDGFRLSLVQTSLSSSIEKSLQIPASFFRDVFFSVIDETQKADLVFHEDGRISIRQNNTVIGTQLVAGDFPPYERVIVRNYLHNIIVPRKELVQSIKTIAIFTREYSNIIILEITGNVLKIRPKKEAGEENKTEIVVETQGQEATNLVLAFNYRYLLDYLSSVEDDFVTLRINRSDSPILFLPGKLDTTEPHEGASYQHIIMPVRIQE